MIGDWLAQAAPFALTAALFFGPGALIGSGLGLRGLRLWSSAPGISVGLLAVLAVVYSWLGVAWRLPAVAIGVLVIAAAVWIGSLALHRGRRRPQAEEDHGRRGRALLLAGLAVGFVLNAARLMTYVGLPTAISQTNDAVFHLNALRWIAETGSASSFTLNGLVGATGFYPAGWHAVASLVGTDAAGAPIAANMVALVIAALVWPLGIAAATRAFGIADRSAAAFAAALSGGLLVFPQLMFEWGVLYPYALSVALVPSAVALTIDGIRRIPVSVEQSVALLVGASGIVVGIALAQPSSVLVWGLFVWIWGLFGLSGVVGRRAHLVATGGLLLGGSALAATWTYFAWSLGPVLWRSYRSVPGAALDVLANSQSGVPGALAMSVLMLLGLVDAARRRRSRWLVALWGILALLYVLAVATDLPVVKRILTGPWYGDSFRIAALAPLVVVPLAAIGLAAGIRAVAGRLPVRRGALLPGAALAAAAVLGAAVVVAVPVVQLRIGADVDLQSRYAMNARSYLSTDEDRLLKRLPDLVPADALLIGNPSTGTGFAYLISTRDIVVRTWSPPQTEAWQTLAKGLRDAAEDPKVCAALHAYGDPGYVLDFGPGSTGPGQYVMPGMTDFAGRDGFERVAHEGDASLWRITACR
ncbi:DUF6541 family protein [Microbacterium xylanilyticum]